MVDGIFVGGESLVDGGCQEGMDDPCDKPHQHHQEAALGEYLADPFPGVGWSEGSGCVAGVDRPPCQFVDSPKSDVGGVQHKTLEGLGFVNCTKRRGSRRRCSC